ncbi:MAG: E3 binding domain-containing protein, partial [Leptolyngbyaceae cyanobacterium CAN_BIN12]|nr:E3 binding domain-containing protein [Leptolyngbyaceae cyanobacterium CAN_BIN12]
MINEVFMPALSSTMTEGKIVAWVKSAGDKVEKGETVVVVESDKADMDVESFYEGYLAAIVVAAGETAPVGAAIALVVETEAEIAAAQQQATVPAKQDVAVTTPAALEAVATPIATSSSNGGSAGNGRLTVSPRARKLAKDLKVDLNTLKGSGPHGRIIAEDVEAAGGIAATPTVVTPVTTDPAVAAPVPVAAKASKPAAAPAPVILGQQVPLNTLQNAVVRNMMVSLEVPTFHVSYKITTDNLDKL